jgi:hypothetical protein
MRLGLFFCKIHIEGPRRLSKRPLDNVFKICSTQSNRYLVTVQIRAVALMAFALLAEIREADDRLYDNHITFVGLWSKEQLKPIVEGLGLPSKMASYAIANLARTLVLEGNFHYSRASEWYADRYKRNGDRYYSYRLTPKAADWLADNCYAEHILGHHVPHQPGAGRQSTIYATQKLFDAIGDLVDPLEPRAIAPRPEVMILRDDQGKDAPYKDKGNPKIRAERADLWTFNDHFQMRELHRNGRLVPIPIFRRIFNRTLDRGGRLYCWGESYQQLSGKERSEITEVIGGITHAFVEIDFRAHHITLAYALAGEPMPEGDPYSIAGYESDEGRYLIKLAGLISFNAGNKKSAVGALVHETGCTWEEAQAAIEAFQAKHPGINEYFFSDAGATLMRMDSDITVAIMKWVLAATGRCPLPVHDSYLVPVCDYHELVKAMREVSAEFFLKSSLKVSGDYSLPLPISIYGDTFFSQTPDRSLLDRYRQKTSPKNVSQQDYEQWIAANLPDDPRPPIEDPDGYLAWFRRNATFLYEKGRYPWKNWRTRPVDYYTWAKRDRVNATLIANGLTLDKLHDRKARRTAAGKKSARTRKANKALSVRVFGYSMPPDELKRALLDVGPPELYGEMRQTYWELTGDVPSSEWDPREVWQWESAEDIYEYDV